MREIDLRGQKCPLPIMNLRRAMKSVKPGEEVLVLFDDTKALTDIKSYCISGGHGFVQVCVGDLLLDWDSVRITKKGTP